MSESTDRYWRTAAIPGHHANAYTFASGTQPDVPHTTMVVPRYDRNRAASEIDSCESEIDTWLQGFNENVPKPTAQADSHLCSDIHSTMLKMIHLTLVNVLHRTQALQPLSDDTPEARLVQENSRAKVKDAARNITKLAHTMLRHDQARFLGLPGVTALVAACLSHMMDIRSSDEDVRDASIFRFYQSMQVLQALSTAWASADSAISFIASVIRKTGISVPEFVASSPLAGSTSLGNNANDNRRLSRHESRPQASSADSQWRQAPLQSILSQGDSGLVSANPGFDIFRRVPESAGDGSQSQGPGLTHFTGDNTQTLDATTTEPFFEWNSSLSSGADFEPIAFNYDFYSDAFGLLDGQSQVHLR